MNVASPQILPRAQGEPERLTKVITVMVALIAATGAISAFLSARESGAAGAATRAGLAAQTRASEQHITAGRILDADFDYISEAEILAFTGTEYDASGLTEDADRTRLLAEFLLTHTYGYGVYYTDAMITESVDQYATLGFDAIWDGYGTFRDDLNAEVDATQAEADQYLTNASVAGGRAEGFLLTITFLAVAGALGAVALATKSPRLKGIAFTIMVALYSLSLANLVYTAVA